MNFPVTKTKERAIELRKKGLSYSEIMASVAVSQSTLSLWLRKVTLTPAQKKRLFLKGRMAGGEAKRRQRLELLTELSNEVQEELPTLIKEPFFLLGLALYWAEGDKQKPWSPSLSVSVGNSDDRIILIMRKWFLKYAKVTTDDLGYRLHIHKTAQVNEALKSWADVLGVAAAKISVTLKYNDSKYRHNRNVNYKGLMNLKLYRSTWFNRRLDLWTQGVAQHFLATSQN